MGIHISKASKQTAGAQQVLSEVGRGGGCLQGGRAIPSWSVGSRTTTCEVFACSDTG